MKLKTVYLKFFMWKSENKRNNLQNEKKTEDTLIFQTGYKEELKAAAGLNKHELFLIKITVF